MARIWCGRYIFWEGLKVFWPDRFFGRSATGDNIVARLPTFPPGIREVEWAHNFHVSKLVAVVAVLMIIDR